MIDPAVFRRVALFANLEPGQLQSLSRVATARRYESAETILRESDPGDQFFVIVQGSVKVFVDSPDGREVVLTHLQAGDFFGEMALLEGETRSASVTALTASEVVVLAREDFFAALAADFALARKVLQALSARLRRANEIIESLALQDVGGRLARYLLRLADESGQPPVDGFFVVHRPTHQEIANSIGATRETVTRMLKQFEDRKLIRIKGSMVWVPSEVPPGARENEWRRR
ncbi:MAG TPA: Crp/Fnr family transcriptional regulator [Thermoanaerobaculia bacterium]|nr:Crp/Fnr family transcriptional regulator [Thermoanaerobaculia bacterium]